MKNCCNCCKCCCKNQCCNKKDDEAIKIDVEKEIETFIAHLRGTSKFLDYRVLFAKKIKNTPTIEIIYNATNNIIYYMEDCLTSNHREFSLDEKIAAIEYLNRFITLRPEKWLNGLKNAMHKKALC